MQKPINTEKNNTEFKKEDIIKQALKFANGRSVNKSSKIRKLWYKPLFTSNSLSAKVPSVHQTENLDDEIKGQD